MADKVALHISGPLGVEVVDLGFFCCWDQGLCVDAGVLPPCLRT